MLKRVFELRNKASCIRCYVLTSICLWNEVTVSWNEVTIFWNEVTVRWNEMTWNELTMERSDRIPACYITQNSTVFDCLFIYVPEEMASNTLYY